LPERAAGEPYDPDLEWDRDGQYYHYLTRWMRALERAGRVANDEHYRAWAVELAEATHRHFVHPRGIYWTMTVDLSPPLVPSQGLAFRELGLPLALHAIAPLGEHADVALLERYVPLAKALEDFWLQSANQAASTWTAHADINSVTLAAALAPRGSLL